MRLFKRSAKRAKGPFMAAPAGSTAAYSGGDGGGFGSTPGAVIIDGIGYQLVGEPPTAPCTVGWFKGNGQR